MNLCVFIQQGNQQVCIRCGRTFTPIGPPPYIANCSVDRSEQSEPTSIVMTEEIYRPLSMAEKAKNFAIAMASFAIAFIKEGPKALVTKEQLQERVNICNDCPAIDPKGNWCRACGCNLRAKQRAKVFDCIQGKWPKL